jgi:cytoskeletal protein RodZ
LLNDYSRQQKWLIGAGVVILILILLLAAAIGYSYNWGNGTSKNAARQAIPTTSDTSPADETNTSDKNGGGSDGGSSINTDHTSSTTNGQNSNTSTTKETTTSNDITTNTNTTTPSSSTLQQLLDEIQVGDNLDVRIKKALNLGITVNCSIEVLIVKVCDFSQSGQTITVRGLLSNGLINSVLNNF